MKTLIYGTGGVGGYFGGKLAQNGNDVTFIARGEHLESIRQNGLKIISPNGDFTIENAQATDDVSSLDPMDLIILGVKSWQVKETILSVKRLIQPNTIVIPLQNGVFANGEIIETIGETNLVSGLCKIISRIESPGVINHMMFDPLIVIGELDDRRSERVEKIQSLFQEADIHTTIASNIDSELWKKFMFICSSGLGALTRATYGEMRALEGTRKLLVDLISEIFSIAKHLQIPIEKEAIENTMKIVDKLPNDATSSMQRDVLEGRPSELDYLTGAVVKLGKANGIDTPVNSFIYHCLLPMEYKNRGGKHNS